MSASLLQSTLEHLMTNVLPAAEEYWTAEGQLSDALKENAADAHWKPAADRAKRLASNLAVAIDGLTDRAANATGIDKREIRAQVASFCVWPGGVIPRTEALERVRAIANAYKHQKLSDPTLPISSDQDVFALGVGWGRDGFGVGKFGSVEVFITDKRGNSWKFLGDAPVAISAWFSFLRTQGVSLPAQPIRLFNVMVHTP